MTDALMPCPFCGDTLDIETNTHLGVVTSYLVICRRALCRATTGYFGLRDEAIAAWNRRTQSPQAGKAEGEGWGEVRRVIADLDKASGYVPAGTHTILRAHVRQYVKEMADRLRAALPAPPPVEPARGGVSIIGYFDDAASSIPTFDPGPSVNCPFCIQPLRSPIKTISLMKPRSDRSYFYRAHRACYETASADYVCDLETGILGDTP